MIPSLLLFNNNQINTTNSNIFTCLELQMIRCKRNKLDEEAMANAGVDISVEEMRGLRPRKVPSGTTEFQSLPVAVPFNLKHSCRHPRPSSFIFILYRQPWSKERQKAYRTMHHLLDTPRKLLQLPKRAENTLHRKRPFL